MRAIQSCFALLVLTVSSMGCDRSVPAESDLAENVRQTTTGNTKNSAAVGGNNAPADDAGTGVTAEQADEAGVKMDDACVGGSRSCAPTR